MHGGRCRCAGLSLVNPEYWLSGLMGRESIIRMKSLALYFVNLGNVFTPSYLRWTLDPMNYPVFPLCVVGEDDERRGLRRDSRALHVLAFVMLRETCIIKPVPHVAFSRTFIAG